MSREYQSFSRKGYQTSFYKKLSLRIIAAISMFGSFLYVYSPTLSFLNLFAFSLTPLYILKLAKNKVNLSGILYFSSLFFFLMLTVVVAITVPSLASAREFRNVVAAIYISALALVCCKVSPKFSFSSARLSFYLLSAIASLQVSYALFGIGFPAKVDEAFQMYGQTGLELAFPSVFSNPNDFSTFVLCYLLVVLVVKRTKVSSDKTLIFDLIVIASMLVISGSKAALVMGIVGLALYSRTASLFVLLSVIGVLAWISISGLGRGDVESDLYAFRRILLDVDLMLSGEVGGSLDVRAGSHLFFLANPGDFFLGSFSYDPVCPQFLPLGGDYLLIATNPHSLIIGAFCSFGILAMPFFSALMLSMTSCFFRFGSSLFFNLYMIAVFLVATSISSWFLSNTQCVFFLVLAFATWIKSKGTRSLGLE